MASFLGIIELVKRIKSLGSASWRWYAFSSGAIQVQLTGHYRDEWRESRATEGVCHIL